MNRILLMCIFSSDCFFSLQAIEDSIIPLVEKYECIENLAEAKYTKSQFTEIANTLSRKDERIRIVSFNVLFNLYDHNLEEVNRWPQRLVRVVEVINDMQADIIGVQELYKSQLDDLMPYLEKEYGFLAKPSEDGELNGIFYRLDRFDLVNSKIWYMSENEQPPSESTLTLAILKDRYTSKKIAALNTHLAFGKIEKREFQARFISKKVKTISKSYPVLLTGDFNTFTQRLDLTLLPFYDGDYIHRLLTEKVFKDAREKAILGHLGPTSTFTNEIDGVEPFKGTGTPGIFLDHIYVSDRISVLIHAVQPAKVNGHFPSDHMPLLTDFIVD